MSMRTPNRRHRGFYDIASSGHHIAPLAPFSVPHKVGTVVLVRFGTSRRGETTRSRLNAVVWCKI